MVEEMIRKMSKNTWYRWSFYINIVLFFIVALFIYFVINDAHAAGEIIGNPDHSSYDYSQKMFVLTRDIAILAIALAIVFYQFFRNLVTIMRRSL